jgi:type IV secretory pathway TraG/TraD family ATPase VirD4
MTLSRRAARLRARWRESPRSLAQIFQRLDADYHIPRPATAQHLPSYQAGMLFVGVCVQAALVVGAGFASAWLFWKSARWLQISVGVELLAHCLGIAAVLVSWLEAAQLWLPFRQRQQLTTYGTARWADARTLADLRLARRRESPLPPHTLRLGGLGAKHDVVLGPEHSTCHIAMFGPPRSGKSSTFFIAWQRAWAGTGSAVVLDPKGELYDQTACLFRRVYRLDLQNPERSDHWNFLPPCRRNPEFAHKVATMILDAVPHKNSTADPFWREAEKAALTAILLQLGEMHPRPAPPMIQELIATLTLAELNELMMSSPEPKVPFYWGMFSKVEPKLQAGVLIGLGVACADFGVPNVAAISSPVLPARASRGVRAVDFAELRRPGTVVFVVVAEGDAERYKRVLATFFGLANDCLRGGELTPESAPVLFNLDEVGNIYIPDLPASLGVGRGRLMTYALGYQNIAQGYEQYGADGFDAILGSVGAMIFLPGLDQRTAEYAAKRLGTTTVLQSTSVDVRKGDRFDSERTSEVGRPLMDAAEIRQMTKYKQAVAIISNAPPVRLSYPNYAKVDRPPLCDREKQFRRGSNSSPEPGSSAVKPPPPEASEASFAQATARQKPEEERAREAPLRQKQAAVTSAASAGRSWKKSGTSENRQFQPVSRQDEEAVKEGKAVRVAESGLVYEPEYDPALIDEHHLPAFDLDSQEW